MVGYMLLIVFIMIVTIQLRIGAEPLFLRLMCDVKQLRHHLLNGHDPNIRPVCRHSEPTTVHLDFFIDSIVEFDEKVGKFSISGCFKLKWIDEFLKWNKTDFGDIQEIKVSAKEIWTPELTLQNPNDRAKSLTGNDPHATVKADGLVEWHSGQIYSVSCQVQELYYPIDYQNCLFTYFVFGSHVTDVKLVTKHTKVMMSHFQHHGEWELVDTHIQTRIHGNAHLLDVKLLIKRRPLFILITTLVPMTFLSVLNLFVFCVPVETGEKTAFSITIYLSYGVFLSGIINSLPNQQTTATSYYTAYLMSLLGISGIIVLLTTVQCRLYYYHSDRKVPLVLVCVFERFKKRKKVDQIAESKDQKMKVPDDRAVLWKDVMFKLDRLLFVLFFILLLLITFGFFVVLFYPANRTIGDNSWS